MAQPLDGTKKATVAPKDNLPAEDVEIAIRMGVQMLEEGQGLQTIEAAINESQDPAQVIGQFLAQLMAGMAEQLGNQINLDPRVFLAKGGWLEHMLDYIETKLGYPADFSDQIYMQVVETIKAAAMRPPAPNNVMSGGPAQGGLGG